MYNSQIDKRFDWKKDWFGVFGIVCFISALALNWNRIEYLRIIVMGAIVLITIILFADTGGMDE